MHKERFGAPINSLLRVLAVFRTKLTKNFGKCHFGKCYFGKMPLLLEGIKEVLRRFPIANSINVYFSVYCVGDSACIL